MVYNISDERCSTFDPSEKSSAANVAAQSEKLPVIDILAGFEFKATPVHAHAIEKLFSEDSIRCMEPSTPTDVMAEKVQSMLSR